MGYPIAYANPVYPLVFYMEDSSTGNGKTGLSPTVTLSKNGGAPASPAGAVSEIGGGHYKVAANATDSDTLGPLSLYATASGAKAAHEIYPVAYHNPFSLFESYVHVLANGGAFEDLEYGKVHYYLRAAAAASRLLYDGPCVAVTSTTVTLDPNYRSPSDLAYSGAVAIAWNNDNAGGGGPIASYNGTTGVITLGPGGDLSTAHTWSWIEIYANKNALRAPLLDTAGRVHLASAGLDAVTVESGVNARQALAGTLATAGGNITGAGSSGLSTITVKGANTGTTRFSASCDGLGNRTVTFTPPT